MALAIPTSTSTRTSASASARDTLAAAVHSMQAVLRSTAPDSLSGDEARSLVELFAQAERSGASGIALSSSEARPPAAQPRTGVRERVALV